jgi:hypothetical protein
MSYESLSPTQFNTQRSLIHQGNTDELRAKVAGIQHATANIFKPSFSSDYTSVRYNPSPASARPGGSGMEEDDEE